MSDVLIIDRDGLRQNNQLPLKELCGRRGLSAVHRLEVPDGLNPGALSADGVRLVFLHANNSRAPDFVSAHAGQVQIILFSTEDRNHQLGWVSRAITNGIVKFYAVDELLAHIDTLLNGFAAPTTAPPTLSAETIVSGLAPFDLLIQYALRAPASEASLRDSILLDHVRRSPDDLCRLIDVEKPAEALAQILRRVLPVAERFAIEPTLLQHESDLAPRRPSALIRTAINVLRDRSLFGRQAFSVGERVLAQAHTEYIALADYRRRASVIREFLEYRNSVTHSLCPRLVPARPSALRVRSTLSDTMNWPFVLDEAEQLLALGGSLFGLLSPALDDAHHKISTLAPSLRIGIATFLSGDDGALHRVMQGLDQLRSVMAELSTRLFDRPPRFDEQRVLDYLTGRTSIHILEELAVALNSDLFPISRALSNSTRSDPPEYRAFWPAYRRVQLLIRTALVADGLLGVAMAEQEVPEIAGCLRRELGDLEQIMACWAPSVDHRIRAARLEQLPSLPSVIEGLCVILEHHRADHPCHR